MAAVRGLATGFTTGGDDGDSGFGPTLSFYPSHTLNFTPHASPGISALMHMRIIHTHISTSHSAGGILLCYYLWHVGLAVRGSRWSRMVRPQGGRGCIVPVVRSSLLSSSSNLGRGRGVDRKGIAALSR